MGDMLKLFGQVLVLSWVLAQMGLLGHAHMFMAKLAVDANKRGYLSISEYHQRLVNGK